jgi:hypothetical protein
MATTQEKGLCIPWFLEVKSETQVQRNSDAHFGRNFGNLPEDGAPHIELEQSVTVWLQHFPVADKAETAELLGLPYPRHYASKLHSFLLRIRFMLPRLQELKF